MARTFLGIGSNLRPQDNIPLALAALAARVRLVAISTVFRCPAVGPENRPRPDLPEFINAVVEVATELDAAALRQLLRDIEADLGRHRSADRYAPRPIDLDILLHGDPPAADPDIAHRAFLAVPLAELAPDLALPGDGRTLRQVADATDGRSLRPLDRWTEELRRRFLP